MEKKSLAETHPEIAKEWHPTKNGSLTPHDITAGSGKKVWWLLSYDDPITGNHFNFEWKAQISSRMHGNGCPYLSGNAIWKGFNDLATTHPELAKEWHPIKNGSLTPHDVIAGSNKKVWWLLPYDDPITGKHFDFEWEAPTSSRTRGYGCPYLSHAIQKGFNDLATTHPELAKEWHPQKNGNITPHNITASSGKKVWWIGSCGHEWKTTVAMRSGGSNCPICVSSKSEQKTYIFFKLKSIKFKKEYSFSDCKHKKMLRFDYAVFDSKGNLKFLLELDGEQHNREDKSFFHKHKSYKDCNIRDNIKTQYCKDNNIPLIRIPESEFKNLENILEKTLKEYSLI